MGETGATLLEANEAGERRKPLEHAGEARLFPLVFDVRREARDNDDVERALPHDLIGDVHVAALRGLRLWS